MSEEEKRAVEFLKGVCTDDCVNKAFVVTPILNLIEKQQKELNSLKEIEKSHQEENGKLRVELEQEKAEKESIYNDYQDLGKDFYKRQEELDRTIELLNRCNERLESISRELGITNEDTYGYVYEEILEEIKQIKEDECTATKCQIIKQNYISKDKIRKFIEEELPEEEICNTCDIYDVNSIELKGKLLKLLEE